ncbi:MAG: sulfite exporter TauE/SafE family protein [Proteobacteria bacterium]|nr:sulfite exporter TauE/SafE family protein [Pseudomonadota bacterium]
MFGFEPAMLAIIAAAVLTGGVVKGVTGVGLPIVFIAIMLHFLHPHAVLALAIAPIMVTNLWQAAAAGAMWAPVRRFWPMAVCLLVSLWFSARLVVAMEPDVLFGALGVCVVIFSAASLVRPGRGLTPATERWLGPLAGLAGGFLGGISTIWGPPMMMFFVMLRLPKETFVRTVGFLWFAASIPLLIAYVDIGIVTAETLPGSLFACVPGMIGLWIGARIRRRIDQETFRRVMLVALFLIGLNLIRRAIF